jgi:hypothetical protein
MLGAPAAAWPTPRVACGAIAACPAACIARTARRAAVAACPCSAASPPASSKRGVGCVHARGGGGPSPHAPDAAFRSTDARRHRRCSSPLARLAPRVRAMPTVRGDQTRCAAASDAPEPVWAASAAASGGALVTGGAAKATSAAPPASTLQWAHFGAALGAFLVADRVLVTVTAANGATALRRAQPRSTRTLPFGALCADTARLGTLAAGAQASPSRRRCWACSR